MLCKNYQVESEESAFCIFCILSIACVRKTVPKQLLVNLSLSVLLNFVYLLTLCFAAVSSTTSPLFMSRPMNTGTPSRRSFYQPVLTKVSHQA
jgi:hypothetical protein